MSQVRLRESHTRSNRLARHRRKAYPLFESHDRFYNYGNLHDCIKNWMDYADSESTCIEEAIKHLDTIYHLGSLPELNEAVILFNEECLSYCTSPKSVITYLERNPQIMNEDYRNHIIEEAHIYSECDRISRNYRTLNDRYDILRMLTEAIRFWSINEAVFRLCKAHDGLINRDEASKMAIVTENTLYAFSELAQEYEIPVKHITECIIDYYLLNKDPNESVVAFLENVNEAMNQSIFIDPNISTPYLNYLKNINEETDLIKSVVDSHYNEDAIAVIAEYDKYYNMKNSMQQFYEASILDKSKEWMAKLKLAPIKGLGMVKEAINAALVTSRLQDIKEGTHNALAIAFYAAVTIGSFTVGAIPGILALVSSALLHKFANKEYLKSAISEWKDHRRSIEAKLKNSSDDEQRRKLHVYAEELDKNIEMLEREWENTRDRTKEEMDEAQPKKPETNPNSWSTDVDPRGRYTPSSLFHKQD